MELEDVLQKFISNKMETSRPFLLALSGGVDSLALFHGLLALKQKMSIAFEVAHVDHGWRNESGDEAKSLEQQMIVLGIPFHFLKLDPKQLEGNLEMACRIERYKFFGEVCDNRGLQGVLVGHHKDDQAETVLKRVLEGANWSTYAGLKEKTIVAGVVVYRPFLSIYKKELIKYLERLGVQAFEDRTNVDIRFLRGRMRVELLPWLNAKFGKRVESSLIKLSEEMSELEACFESRFGSLFKQVVVGIDGMYLSLAEVMSLSTFELKYLVRRFCRMGSVEITADQLRKAVEAVQAGEANKSFGSRHRQLIVDRQTLFLLLNESEKCWKLSEEGSIKASAELGSWRDVWEGCCEAALMPGNYELRLWSQLSEAENRKQVDKLWTNEKVPAFLRERVPLVCCGNMIVHEFLSGRRLLKPEDADQYCWYIMTRGDSMQRRGGAAFPLKSFRDIP